jgi:hypothetical protein
MGVADPTGFRFGSRFDVHEFLPQHWIIVLRLSPLFLPAAIEFCTYLLTEECIIMSVKRFQEVCSNSAMHKKLNFQMRNISTAKNLFTTFFLILQIFTTFILGLINIHQCFVLTIYMMNVLKSA